MPFSERIFSVRNPTFVPQKIFSTGSSRNSKKKSESRSSFINMGIPDWVRDELCRYYRETHLPGPKIAASTKGSCGMEYRQRVTERWWLEKSSHIQDMVFRSTKIASRPDGWKYVIPESRIFSGCGGPGSRDYFEERDTWPKNEPRFRAQKRLRDPMEDGKMNIHFAPITLDKICRKRGAKEMEYEAHDNPIKRAAPLLSTKRWRGWLEPDNLPKRAVPLLSTKRRRGWLDPETPPKRVLLVD